MSIFPQKLGTMSTCGKKTFYALKHIIVIISVLLFIMYNIFLFSLTFNKYAFLHAFKGTIHYSCIVTLSFCHTVHLSLDRAVE